MNASDHHCQESRSQESATTGELEGSVVLCSKEVVESRKVARETVVSASSVVSKTAEEEQASGGEIVAVVQSENVQQQGRPFDSVLPQRQRQEEEYNSILHSLEDLGLDASDFDPSPLLSSTDGSGTTSTSTNTNNELILGEREDPSVLTTKNNTTTSNNEPTNHYLFGGDSDSSSFYLNEGEEEVLRSVLEGLILGDEENDDADGNILGLQTNQEGEGTRNTATVCPPSAASYEQEEHFPSTVPGDDNNDFPPVNGTTSNSRVFGVLSSFNESTLEQPFEDDIYNPNDLFPDIITTTDEVVPLIENEGEEQQVTQQHPTTTTSEDSNQPFADSNASSPLFDNLEELLLLQQLGDIGDNDGDDDINSWDAHGDSDIEQEDSHKNHNDNNDNNNTNDKTIGDENDILLRNLLISKDDEDEDFFVTSDIFDDIDSLLNHTTNITGSNEPPNDNKDKVVGNTNTKEKEELNEDNNDDDNKSEINENASTNTSSSEDNSSHKDSAKQRQRPLPGPLSYTNVFSDDEDDSSIDENDDDTRNTLSIQHPPQPRGKPASFLLTHYNQSRTKQQADEETELSEGIKDTNQANDNSEIDPSQDEEEEHHLYKNPLSDSEERRLTQSLLSQLRLPKDSDDDDENDETHSKKKDEDDGSPPLTLDLDHHSLDVYDRHHLEESNEQRSPKEEKTSTTTAEEAALLAAKKHTVIRQRQKLSRSHQSKHQLPMIDEDQEQTIDIKVDSSCKMPHRDPDVVQAEAEHAAQPFLDAFGISAATIIRDNTNTTTTTSKSSTKPQSFKKKTNPAERICYGHKETVFGASFSPCGRLLATASQDSTIIVWNVTTHSILTTLRGHSRDYECLRVAWAPVATTSSSRRNNDETAFSSPQPEYWGQHVLPPLPNDVAAILESSSKQEEEEITTAGTTTKCNVLMLASSSANGVVKLWRLILLEEEDATATSSNTKLKLACVPECVATFDHSLQNGYGNKIPGLSEDELPQIYSLQFIQEWMNVQQQEHNEVPRQEDELLLSSADDEIHLWELTKCQSSETSEATVRFNIVFIMQFVNLDQGLGGVKMRLPGEKDEQSDMTHSPSPQDDEDETAVFGGTARNPKRKVFVFDATHCPANHLLAVALADGTARIVNGRGICVSILELPGSASHLTAVSWDNTTGTRLATSAATGHVILWKLEQELVTMMIDDEEQHDQEGREVVVAPQQIPSGKDEDNMNGDNNKTTKLIPTGRYFPSCTAVLQGGHVPGRPLFGTCFCSGSSQYDKQELLLSWGVDGKLCLWNSDVEGYGTPIAVLKSSDDYPIYTVDVTKFKGSQDSTITAARAHPNNQSNGSTDTNETTTAATKRHLVVGGGTDGGFIGIPVYIYEI